MSDYAKNIQKIEDLWKKRIGLPKLTEIVRCRDCKYLNKLSREHEVYECCLTYMDVTLDGFCAWAERREQ